MFRDNKLRYLWLAAALLMLTCAPLYWAQSAPAATDLPAGDMQAKAHTACLECHESRIIAQQRLSKATWTKEVDKMTKWGAVVDPKDHDALIDYLSSNFPPEKSAEPEQRVARASATKISKRK